MPMPEISTGHQHNKRKTMFCDLESHFKQQYEALLVSLGVFVGPSIPIVQQLAEQMSKLEAPKPHKQ